MSGKTKAKARSGDSKSPPGKSGKPKSSPAPAPVPQEPVDEDGANGFIDIPEQADSAYQRFVAVAGRWLPANRN